MRQPLKLTVFLISALLIAGLAACSAGDAQEAPPVAAEIGAAGPESNQSPTPLPAQAEYPKVQTYSAGPRRGGNLVLASMADYPHRDVHQTNQETLATLGPGLAYSRLMRVGTGPEFDQPNLTMECDLCQSWELAPDMSYVFHLRSDVFWHDTPPVNGRALVADDLVFSYQRMQTEGWPGESRFKNRGIGEIEALDKQTLKVSLNFQDSDALLAFADGRSKIVAPEVVAQFGNLRQAPIIGTGPWLYEEDTRGDSVEFNRNPIYYEPGIPYLDGLHIETVKAETAGETVNVKRVALLQAGQIDVVVAPPTDWEQLDSSGAEFNSRVSQQPEIGMVLSLNSQAEPLNNLAIRQAIFRAVDPWEYVDTKWLGQGGVGMGMPLPNPDWQLAQTDLLADYLGSPSIARDILEENGVHYPPTLEIAVADLAPEYQQVAQQIKADLELVGFGANVTAMHPAELQEALFGDNRNYQIALAPAPPHPTTNGYLYSLLHSGGPGNIANHNDEVMDALIQVQAAELDPEKRQEQLLRVQRRALEKAYMFSPITGAYRWVFNWDLENFYPNTALSEYHYWTEAWLKQ